MTTQRTRTSKAKPRESVATDRKRPAPESPADFVAEAERMTNERDIEGVRDVYAPDATWISTVDGMVMRAQGIEEIVARWGLMCRFMQARRMYVQKQLVTSDERTVVNEWTGSLGDRTAARGIEVWRFDDQGRVHDQHLYGFLNTGSDTDALPSLRMLASYPMTALTFGRLRLTSGRTS